MLGHNGTIGWGFTTTNLDSQDLFIERVDPTDPNRYITPDGPRPFSVREETINVRWGEPITMRVRETRHGPVIDDIIRRTDDLTPQGHVLALQATALDGADTSAEGFGRLGLAQNWEEFLAAARRIVSPMQNMVYADTAGNVGLIAPARVPIRRKGDGSMPVPGWTSEFDWAGFVPFDELPRLYNPTSGIIVNANGRLVPDDYRHFISRDWAEPYRQRRANQLLREVERHPVYGMIVMQADNRTLDADDMLPVLLKGAPRNARAARAHAMLKSWNRFMLASRPEPLIYTAWIWELQRGIMADELGEELFQTMATPDVPLMLRIIREKPGWCDDGGTRQTETCEDAIALALDRALAWISAPARTGHRELAMGHRARCRPSPSDVRRRAAPARHRLGALPLGRRCADAEPRPALLPRQPAVRGHPWRGLSRRLRLQRPRQQPLRHAARPVGQHALAMGPQLRPALAEPELHRDRRHPRRARPQRRRHDHAHAAGALSADAPLTRWTARTDTDIPGMIDACRALAFSRMRRPLRQDGAER